MGAGRGVGVGAAVGEAVPDDGGADVTSPRTVIVGSRAGVDVEGSWLEEHAATTNIAARAKGMIIRLRQPNESS